MPAKPLTLLACASLALGAALIPPVSRAASPATLLLFPRTLTNADDLQALIDVRKKLRADGTYDVITYDPNSAAIKRAAAESHHPEWLTDPMGNDPERLALTRALGASFAIIIASEGRGKLDVRVDEANLSGRTWNGYDEKPDAAAMFIRQHATFALANGVASPALTMPRPVAVPAASVIPAAPIVSVPASVISPPAPASVVPIAVPTPAIAPVPSVAPPPASDAPPSVSVPPPIMPARVTAPPLTAPVPASVAAPVPHMPIPLAAPAPVLLAPPVTVPSVSVPKAVRPLPAPAVVVPSDSTPPQSQTLIVPSPLPIPAPSQVVIAPAPEAAPAPVPHPDDDLVPVRTLLTQGDDALGAGDFVAAIAAYRDAVNGVPLAMTPRLKLAQAYLQSDRRDKALSEAQRALDLSPGNPAVQQFLMQLDAETGSSDGAVTRFQAVVAQNPQDPSAHLELADALWNNGALSQADDEYRTAQSLAGPQTPLAQQAAAHLARLYAAQSRYADSLAALKQAGAGGYALALGIVQSRADTLRSMLDSGLDQMNAGKITHEAFYKTASDAAAQSQALADFVVQVTPPSAFGVSHLHRVLATHLMAQQAAVLVNYVETSDASFSEQAGRLEKEALTEMLTAHAAEQKLGLWDLSRTEARN